MVSLKMKFLIFVLLAGLLSACAGSATQAVAPSIEASAPVTQAPTTTLPTDTSVPPAENPPTTEAAASTAVSFDKDIVPILDGRCVNCHGGQRTEEGLVLKSYADLMQGSKNGAVVLPGDASKSLLAQLVENQKMPKRGPKLTPPQIQLIIDWINQGALNN